MSIKKSIYRSAWFYDKEILTLGMNSLPWITHWFLASYEIIKDGFPCLCQISPNIEVN